MAINFFKGHPTIELLPQKLLAETFGEVIQTPGLGFETDPENRHPLQYGTDLGNVTVRSAVSDWVNSQFGRKSAKPDKINLTGGASYGAANALLTCTSPEVTKQAFIVLPTYFLINYAFIDAGLAGKLTAIRETPGQKYDIDLEHLEAKLTELDAKYGHSPVTSEINVLDDPTGRGDRKVYRYVMYLVPAFSNPGGLVYSAETREKLVEIARKHDLLLLSDDVYDHLAYEGNPGWRKLNHIDEDTLPAGWRFGNTISNCSFSKIVAPGLRTGWQETATSALALQLATTGANKSGGTPGQLQTNVVEKLIRRGQLDTIVAHYRKTYRSRAEVMRKALAEHLPSCAKIYNENGGYFFWVQVDGVDLAHVIAKVEEEHRVVIPQGGNFEVNGDLLGWGKSGARLCVSFLGEKDIEHGIRLWGQVFRQLHPLLY